MNRMLAGMALVALMIPSAEPAAAAEFKVKPGGENRVVFTSRATVESFHGKTKHLAGSIVVDPQAVGDSIQVHLEVDLTTLDTGIARRNQHMRVNHLETASYPKAVFDGAAVLGPGGAKLAAGSPVTFDCEGTFSLHGVSRRIHIQVAATYAAKPGAGSIRFETTFPVALADYKISRPQFLFLKLADTQEVKVTGVAVAG